MSFPFNILIVDDELNIRKTLALCLEAEGHSATAVANEEDAERENLANAFDVCFLDLRLGVKSGLDLLPKLLAENRRLKVIIITAFASIETAVEAMRRGAFDYLPKPFSTADVYAVLQKLQAVTRLEDRVRELEAELSKGRAGYQFKSQSRAMQKALELAEAAASSSATVLITGENGTGKTVLARALHGWSSRAAAPFATVSCPSLSPELLESELFGHVKGAFTSALRANPGRIAAAEGGTLFLDEIGDLPMPLQAKLLRFLQEREYEQVGDTKTRRADVRVIAATNVDLKEAVKAGRFREDLYYRLNVIPIEMPSLRDRPEDLRHLAESQLLAIHPSKKILGFTKAALEKLEAYDWPGNLRELHNVIERASILCRKDLIDAQDLAVDVAKAPKKSAKLQTLEDLEETHIRKVLDATRSMEQAAQTLGIDTVTLWRKRKKYGL